MCKDKCQRYPTSVLPLRNRNLISKLSLSCRSSFLFSMGYAVKCCMKDIHQASVRFEWRISGRRVRLNLGRNGFRRAGPVAA